MGSSWPRANFQNASLIQKADLFSDKFSGGWQKFLIALATLIHNFFSDESRGCIHGSIQFLAF
jgi:hypothetical protein